MMGLVIPFCAPTTHGLAITHSRTLTRALPSGPGRLESIRTYTRARSILQKQTEEGAQVVQPKVVWHDAMWLLGDWALVSSWNFFLCVDSV